MSDRKDFFFRQKVTESELDEAFDDLENADRNIVIDANAEGVWFGLAVSENGLGQDESVDVAAGSAYDQDGQRMHLPSLQNLDVSVDLLSASTQVGSSGNEKLVGVYLKFDRALSDPRVDGNSVTVFFERDESYQFVVRQGPEEVAPATTAPALQADEILLADIRRKFNDNTIADADIETTRRQNSWVQTIGESSGIDATEVALAVSNTWADATGIAATDVDAGFEEVVSDLSGSAGAAKLGASPSGVAWAGPESLSFGTIQAAIAEIVGDLSVVSPTSGAARVGFQANQSQWTNTANALAAGTIQAAIDEIVTDLADQGPTPGAALVGANAYSGTTLTLADGSIEDQLQTIADTAVSLSSANTWTNQQTFDYTASDTAAIHDFRHPPVAGNRKLISRGLCNGTSNIEWRLYTADDPVEAVEITINASWNGTQWVADDTTASYAAKWILSSNGDMVVFTEATPTVAWSDAVGAGWDDVSIIDSQTGDFTSTQQATGHGSLAATEGSIGVSNTALAVSCPYSHTFASSPSSITGITTGGFNTGATTNEISSDRTKICAVLENDPTTPDAYVDFTFLAS